MLKKLLKEDESLSGDDCREGLTAVISVKLEDAQFESQTKAKLGNSDVKTLVNNIVGEKLEEFYNAHEGLKDLLRYTGQMPGGDHG